MLCMHNDAHRVMAENLFAPRANHVLYNDLREDDRELHGARFIVNRIDSVVGNRWRALYLFCG